MTDAASRSGSAGPGRQHDFDEIYRGQPPWDIGRPQEIFADLARSGRFVGRVLDSGCGTGEHTLLAASLGLDAVGVDLAAAAIAAAEAKAAERGSTARFAVHDVLALDRLGSDHPHLAGGYDTVIDSGVFHVFDDADRARYVRSLATVVNPGGHYLMAVFSDRQPGDWGPRRVTEAEIRSSFSDGWTIESLLPAVFSITIDPAGAQAWVGVIRRH